MADADLGDPSRHNHPIIAQNEILGDVQGLSVQVQEVSGSLLVNYMSPTDQLPVPRQLRRPPVHFTNRSKELGLLDSTQAGPTSRCPVILLKGPGGVGKTSLALRWLHNEHEKFSDGQLYTDLREIEGSDAVSVAEILGQFLRALGVSPSQVPATFPERVALFRSVTAQRSLAILLDNAGSAAQVKALTPQSDTCVVVVTSHRALYGLLSEGARVVDVAPFHTDHAVELLTRALGQERVAAEPEPAADLAALCGGMPIALSVVAARLAARPRRSLLRAVRELDDERRRLAALSAEEGLSVQATFDLAYAELPPSLAHAYRLLSLHPGDMFGVGPASAALGQAPEHTVVMLDGLVEASLLDEVDEDRFRFHDLVRVHARGHARSQESEQDRASAVRNMIEWYLAAAQVAYQVLVPARRLVGYEFTLSQEQRVAPAAASATGLAWLEDNRIALMDSVRIAHSHGWYELAWHLADVLRPLFLFHKHYGDAERVETLGLASAREWGNVKAEVSMLKRLSGTSLALGELERAEGYARAVLENAEQRADVKGLASAHKRLAHVFTRRGEHDAAVAHFRTACRTAREGGFAHAEALGLIDLARLLVDLARAPEALDLAQRACALLNELPTADRYNLARGRLAEGRAQLGCGDLQAAEALLNHAEGELLLAGAAFERGLAQEALGELAVARGRPSAAREHFVLAATAFAAVGSARARELAERASALGD